MLVRATLTLYCALLKSSGSVDLGFFCNCFLLMAVAEDTAHYGSYSNLQQLSATRTTMKHILLHTWAAAKLTGRIRQRLHRPF